MNKKGALGFLPIIGIILIAMISLGAVGYFLVITMQGGVKEKTIIDEKTGEVTVKPIEVISENINKADTVSRTLEFYDSLYEKSQYTKNATNGTVYLFTGGNGVGSYDNQETGTDGKYTYTKNRDLDLAYAFKGVGHYIVEGRVKFDPALASSNVVQGVVPYGTIQAIAKNITRGNTGIESGATNTTAVSSLVNQTIAGLDVNAKKSGFRETLFVSESYKEFGQTALYLGCSELDTRYDVDVTGMVDVTKDGIPTYFQNLPGALSTLNIKRVYKLTQQKVTSSQEEAFSMNIQRNSGSSATIYCVLADEAKFVKTDQTGVGTGVGDDQRAVADVGASNLVITIPTG